MSSEKLLVPEPLVPPEVDLTGFPSFGLNVERLLASELVALCTPQEGWAAVMLWARAWQQTPPGSLPNNERVLAAFAKAKSWKQVRAMALRGFILCSDGRLYHPVLAAEAMRCWESRLKHQAQQAKNTEKLRSWRAKQQESNLRRIGNVTGKMDGVTGFVTGYGTGKRGKGIGEGEKNKSYSGGVGSSNAVCAVDDSGSPPLSADEIGKHLVQLEAQRDKELRLNPRAYEALHRLADRQIGLPVLLGAHALACVRRTADGDSSPVNPAFLESFIDEAKVERQQGTATPPGWDGTTEGVLAKAAELGLPSQRADEQWFWYRLLVIKAAGDQHLIDREVSRAERMNPNEHERVYRFFHEAALGKAAA